MTIHPLAVTQDLKHSSKIKMISLTAQPFLLLSVKPNFVLSLPSLRLKVSMDDNCTRLTYLEFLSAFNHKAEKKPKPPPASPYALRQIESLDNLSPAMALATMRELASVSAPNLYKVTPSTTGIFILSFS